MLWHSLAPISVTVVPWDYFKLCLLLNHLIGPTPGSPLIVCFLRISKCPLAESNECQPNSVSFSLLHDFGLSVPVAWKTLISVKSFFFFFFKFSCSSYSCQKHWFITSHSIGSGSKSQNVASWNLVKAIFPFHNGLFKITIDFLKNIYLAVSSPSCSTQDLRSSLLNANSLSHGM